MPSLGSFGLSGVNLAFLDLPCVSTNTKTSASYEDGEEESEKHVGQWGPDWTRTLSLLHALFIWLRWTLRAVVEHMHHHDSIPCVFR